MPLAYHCLVTAFGDAHCVVAIASTHGHVRPHVKQGLQELSVSPAACFHENSVTALAALQVKIGRARQDHDRLLVAPLARNMQGREPLG